MNAKNRASAAAEEEEFKDRDFLKGKDLSVQSNQMRPPVPSMLDDRKHSVEFMQIDCDYYTERNQNQSREENEAEAVGKPVLRMFGVNAEGNSVAAHVHNFSAYMYIQVVEPIELTKSVVEDFRVHLNRALHSSDAVLEVEVQEKSTVMHYQKGLQTFLKVFVSHPKFITQLASLVDKGLNINGRDCLS